MTDDAIEDSLDPDMPQPDDTAAKLPQKMEPAFYAALALVGVLVLLIVFMNIPGTRASAGITLTRSDWTLQSYAEESEGLVPALSGTPVTASFDKSGRMNGSSGCNQYTASYTTRDFAITISSVVATEMYCDDPALMHQESVYLANLAKAVELRVNTSNLNLYDSSGKPLLVFEVSQ